jgi:hypothetical protein
MKPPAQPPERLSEKHQMCRYGNYFRNCFLPWQSFQSSERVIHESNGNRFSLSPGVRAGVRAGFKPKLNCISKFSDSL